jgi:hypothetical protein
LTVDAGEHLVEDGACRSVGQRIEDVRPFRPTRQDTGAVENQGVLGDVLMRCPDDLAES